MTFPWSKRLRGSDTVIRCPNPKCDSDFPKRPLGPLVHVVVRSGEAKAIQGGYDLACRECGAQFSVGPNGRIARQRPQERAVTHNGAEDESEAKAPIDPRRIAAVERSLRSRGPLVPRERPEA